jgi:hypothetical protein
MPPKPEERGTADSAELCRLLNLTTGRLTQLARDGVIFRQGRGRYHILKSVHGYVTFLQRRVRGEDVEPTDKAKQSLDLAALVEQVKAANSYQDARTLKTQIDALRSGFSLEVEQGRYISREQVDEGLIETITHLRSAILSMAGELPPHLEGLPAAEVERQLRIYADRMIADLKDSLDRLGETAQDEPAKPSPKLAKPRGRPRKPKPETR